VEEARPTPGIAPTLEAPVSPTRVPVAVRRWRRPGLAAGAVALAASVLLAMSRIPHPSPVETETRSGDVVTEPRSGDVATEPRSGDVTPAGPERVEIASVAPPVKTPIAPPAKTPTEAPPIAPPVTTTHDPPPTKASHPAATVPASTVPASTAPAIVAPKAIVRVTGVARARLLDTALHDVGGPGAVAPGSYTLEVWFDDGAPTRVLTFDLAGGETRTISCTASMKVCR
jgi:hypothetical protein